MHGKTQKSSDSTKTEPHKFFDTQYLKSDLKERSVRGGAITLTSQVIKFLLQTGSTIVLARLLTPQDYGLIAMVTVITGFIAQFKDMGLSKATIQRTKINQSQVSTLFWINVAVSFALVFLLSVGAPIISKFYGEPRLTWIVLALAGTFILSGLSVQHIALLERQMSFKTLAAIDIGSLFISIITGIALAWYGARYWALVGMSVVFSLSSMIMAWILCRWRPSLPLRRSGIRSMVKFGGQITGFDIINYFSRNFDNILLGRYWGANVLGLYSKAYGIMMLPIHQVRGPLNSVAFPVLSHLQNDPIRHKNYYTKLITLLSFITMPIMAFLFVCADQVILLLLGSQWLGAIQIFKILCISAFLQPIMGTAGLVLLSLGQSKRYFIIGTLNSIIIIISFIIGLPWGAVGVAAAYTIANYVLFVPTLWYCLKQTSITLIDFFLAIYRSIIASLIMGLVIFSVRSYLNISSIFMSIGCSLIIGFLTYLITMIFLPGGLQILKELFSYRTLLFQKKST